MSVVPPESHAFESTHPRPDRPTALPPDARPIGAEAAVPALPAQGAVAPPARRFVCTATGASYFRVWIVNLLLSVVTVGFYSPWAKVRRLRYLYGNTLFDGSPFEFHGDPVALLKGRIVGLVLLGAYTQAGKLSTALWYGVVACLVALFPWLLWKSLRFRLANTSYRGLRFGFDGTLRDAYAVFVPIVVAVVGPAVVLVFAGDGPAMTRPGTRAIVPYVIVVALAFFAVPWLYFRLRRYQHRHARLGSARFDFDGRARSVYAIAGKAFLVYWLVTIVATIVGFGVGAVVNLAVRRIAPQAAQAASVAIGVALGYAFLISGWSPVRAMIQNFVWSRTTLDGHRFVSTAGRFAFWRIEFVNLVATVATLGLFWPFAVVRSYRYRLQSVGWSGDSDALAGSRDAQRVGATGEEAVDLFGFDLAL